MPEEIDYSKMASAIANQADDEADALVATFGDRYRERVPARGAIVHEGRSSRIVSGEERLRQAKLLAPAAARGREVEAREAAEKEKLAATITEQKDRAVAHQKMVQAGLVKPSQPLQRVLRGEAPGRSRSGG